MGKHARPPAVADAAAARREFPAPALKPRLTIPVSADRSRIAYDALKPETRTQLRALLTDSELRTRLELDPPGTPLSSGAAPADDSFPPDVCGVLYDAISRIMVIVAQRAGYTASQAAVLAFNADDKTKLVPPTCLVIDKYLPGGLNRYGAEAMLAMTALTIVTGKIDALRASKPAAAAVLKFADPPEPIS